MSLVRLEQPSSEHIHLHALALGQGVVPREEEASLARATLLPALTFSGSLLGWSRWSRKIWFFAPTISQALSSSTKRAWKSIPSPEASSRRELLDFSRSEEHKQGGRKRNPSVSDTTSSQGSHAFLSGTALVTYPCSKGKQHSCHCLNKTQLPRCPCAHHGASSTCLPEGKSHSYREQNRAGLALAGLVCRAQGRTGVQPQYPGVLSFQPAFQRNSWSPKASAP